MLEQFKKLEDNKTNPIMKDFFDKVFLDQQHSLIA